MVWCSLVLTTTTLSVVQTLVTYNSITGFFYISQPISTLRFYIALEFSCMLYNTMPLIHLLNYIFGYQGKVSTIS